MTTSLPEDERLEDERIERARTAPDPVPVALEELVDEAVARLFAIGLDINLALPYLSGVIAQRLSAARADTERLAQLLREQVLPAVPAGPAPVASTANDGRLAFLALARHEIRVAERDGTSLELLYLAVHAADIAAHGVDALAGVLVDGCRASDVVARWSETAFVVLMRGAGTTEACEVAYRLQEAYDAREGQRLRLSVGVVRRQAGESLEALVTRAEQQVAQLRHE